MSELFARLWEVLAPAQQLILAVVISLLTAAILWLCRARVKIIWGSTSLNYHEFVLNPEVGKVRISTEKFFIQNVGRKPAKEIQIVLAGIPTSYNLWAPREHQKEFSENGNFLLKIPFLAPSELLIVDVIDLDLNNPKLIAVVCPDAVTKPVEFEAQRQFGNLFNSMAAYFFLSGMVGTFYLILQLLLGGENP